MDFRILDLVKEPITLDKELANLGTIILLNNLAALSHFSERRGSIKAIGQSRLPGGAEQPFLAEFALNLFVRDRPTSFNIGLSTLDGLQHVEMVENVVKRAVLRQAIEQQPNRFL